MRLQKNPDVVMVTDIGAVPVAYKDAVLTLPAYVWETLLNCVTREERKQFEQLVKRVEYRADKRQLAKELKAGTPIPGADLQFGDMRLVVAMFCIGSTSIGSVSERSERIQLVEDRDESVGYSSEEWRCMPLWQNASSPCPSAARLDS